jgi:hypothetical protein
MNPTKATTNMLITTRPINNNGFEPDEFEAAAAGSFFGAFSSANLSSLINCPVHDWT